MMLKKSKWEYARPRDCDMIPRAFSRGIPLLSSKTKGNPLTGKKKKCPRKRGRIGGKNDENKKERDLNNTHYLPFRIRRGGVYVVGRKFDMGSRRNVHFVVQIERERIYHQVDERLVER